MANGGHCAHSSCSEHNRSSCLPLPLPDGNGRTKATCIVTGLDFVYALFLEYSDIVRAAAYLLLAVGAAKVLHIDVGTLGSFIAKEGTDLLKAKPTTGSFNALGLVFIFVFGIFLAVADKLSFVFHMLSTILGEGHAKELISGGAWIAFIALCVFAFVSLRAVERVEVLTIRTRKKK